MNPKEVIQEFDTFLSKRNEKFEGIAIGAGALSIMGVTSRQTVDIDLLTPDIPQNILKLAEEFRKEMSTQNKELITGWINNGPKQVMDALPKDWKSRLKIIFKGKAITLLTLDRPHLIATKLIAFCDRHAHDEEDLLNLKPTKEELVEALPIAKNYDGNPEWPKYAESKIKKLAKSLGHEL